MKNETMSEDSPDKSATYGTSEVDPQGATEQLDAVYEMYQELSPEDKQKFMDRCESESTDETNSEMKDIVPKNKMKGMSKMPKKFSMDEMPVK